MEDITNEMLRFKEAIRHVWNIYLLGSGDPMLPELQGSFSKIERELFHSLVLLPNGVTDYAKEYRSRPMPILIQARTGLSEISVQFGSLDANRNMKWELPCSIPAAELLPFRFIEFFDWNPYGHIDLHYVKAQADDTRFVLIEQTYCDFALDSLSCNSPI